ncbi:CT620/CT621 family type III secretion system effector [Candidatus Chlamydia corallus]|uniref:CT620/CT621 family type III secretion system effector n=1 Tax=Candidatus Chlamydia corallus TaxID=2038470 RepID=UPI000C2FCDD1|nr:CT620/CT621 family type III secretion system effector [Candidatus Chlamydia corallus]
MNPRIEKRNCPQLTVVSPSFEGPRSPSAAVTVGYVDVTALSRHLRLLKDVIKEARNLDLGRTFLTSMKQGFVNTGTELAIMQATLADQSSRETRKKEEKIFHQHLGKALPQASTSTSGVPSAVDPISDKMPLQSAFAYVLLDKYIPSQEEALYALGKELNLSGYAQNLFSPLLEIIKSFNSAPIHYNLGSYISQTSETANFAYGYEMILTRYNNEVTQCRIDMVNTAKAKAALGNMSTSVKANASLTDAQKTQIQDIISGYNKSLDLINTQLTDVMANLAAITFVPGLDKYDPSYRIVGGDISIIALQDREKVLVDGKINVANATTEGGLISFFTTVLTDVQNYGDLAQTQQLMLDLELKAMQQQWSLVSASLKLLNGMYSTVISGFRS